MQILKNNQKNPRDVVIVNAVRTPLCRARKGSFKSLPPSTLLAAALNGCIQAHGTVSKDNKKSSPMLISPSDVQDLCIGNVLSPASGAAALRMAQLSAGFPSSVPMYVINRQCSSGLQAVANIANAISRGDIDIGIGAGVESMSSHPMNKIPAPDVDWDVMNACGEAMDCLIPMGMTSENVSKKFGLNRNDLDRFAAKSHEKASRARAEGKFRAEIVPVGDVCEDDGIRPGTTVEALSKLRPVFDPENGSTTAGNSSQMTDGAAAVLLMSREEAMRRKLPIMGVWRSYAVKGVPPRIMGIGPAVAIPAALQKAGLSTDDVNVYEINEAFASQASWCVEELGLKEERVNPNGGAIALGHPLGCTGARQIATILHEMERSGKRFGVVSMCIGTGMGAAAVLELETPISSL